MKRLLPMLLVLLLLVTGCREEPDIMDSKTPADDIGALYYTNIPLPEGVVDPFLGGIEGDLLVLSTRYTDIQECENQLYRINDRSGEVTHSLVIPSKGYATMQVHGDTICLCSPASGKVWLVSPKLEILQEYTLESNYDMWYVSADLQWVYELSWDKGLNRFGLADGSVTEMIPAIAAPSYSNDSNDWVSFTYVDTDTQMTMHGRLDFAKGEVEAFPYDAAFSPLYWVGDVWAGVPSNNSDAIVLGSGATPTAAVTIPNGYINMTDSGQLLLRDINTGKTSLFATDGSFLSAIRLPTHDHGVGGYFSDFMVWDAERNGWFLTMTTITDNPVQGLEPIYSSDLVFWDLSAQVSGEGLTLSPLYTDAPQGGNAVSKELYDRAAAIGEKYGVTVLIADQCETEFDDFTTYNVNDPVYITLGLDALERALSRYPMGFFSQLRYGTIREIEISLAGGLTPVIAENYDGGVNAFAQPLYDKYVIVIDLYQTSEQSYHHEFSHIIDRRLEWDADHREGAIYSEQSWAALNPADFDYDWSYAVYNSRDYYVPYDYFISSYAMTYPTEDRATIWEHGMMGYDWALNTPQLQEKLLYYSRCIRDCFDTTGWPATTHWEAALQ